MSEHSNNDMWHIEVVGPSVEAEILGLPPDMQARLLRILDLVRSWGPLRVGMLYTRPLMKKL